MNYLLIEFAGKLHTLQDYSTLNSHYRILGLKTYNKIKITLFKVVFTAFYIGFHNTSEYQTCNIIDTLFISDIFS